MFKTTTKSKSNVLHLAISVSAFTGLAISGPVSAVSIDTGVRDLSIRLDTSVRYNLGLRAEDCDPDICGDGTGLRGDVSAHQSDRKFEDAGDIVTNRLDLTSELDVIYKGAYGFRVSATGWYDHAYRNDTAKGDPAFLAAGLNAYPDGSYTDYVERWNHGPSGEILDAFAFGEFNAGEVPVFVKAGQHNVYWGESLFTLTGGVAHGQGPVDFRKALANPGTDAQELFLPVNQVSFSATLTDELTLAGQYILDWEPTRLPDGGTYFGPADFFTVGGGTVVPFFPAEFHGAKEAKDERGDWGLAVKWRPDWLGGTAGFYYREYTVKVPQMVIGGLSGNVPIVDLDYQQDPRQKLYGLSLAKQVGDVSVGAEMTYRKDAQISATPFSNVVGANAQDVDWHPRGDVWTALVNMIAFYGSTPLFDSAALSAELNYSKLQEVTNDPLNVFYGRTENCGATGVATNHGCPTDDAWAVAIQFTPMWYQVLPGVDLAMPLFFGQGIDGNSPIPFGENEGQGSWSIGVNADLYAKYNVSLAYNGQIAKHSQDHLGIASNNNNSLGKYWDRDFVSLTLQTEF